MTILYNYEVSVVGAERNWDVPYSRLEDQTPEVGHAAALLSAIPGTQVGGIVLSIDAALSRAVIGFTPGKIYNLSVRNVITYAAGPDGAEATFRAINIGDPVYYDRSTTIPTDVELSTSPLDHDGVANMLWGYVQAKDETDSALYPKGATTASTQSVGVMARGAGA